MTRIFAQSPLLVRRGGAADVISIAAMQSSISDTAGSSVGFSSATVTIASTGDWSQTTSGESSYNYTGYWISPLVNMSLYSCRWTNTSGTLTFGTAGSWQALTSSRLFSVSRSTVGTKSCTGTLEIALTANTSSILASKSITISADIYNDGGGGPDP